jgi:MarR family 2-MHQ and catechol resistance regulon transcriptional repressor
MPKQSAARAGDALALNTYIKLMRAGDSVATRIKSRGTFDGLSISQFAVLEALFHLGPMRQNQIGAKTLRSPGNLTLVIDNLEKAGLVTRARAADDRRAIVVALTPKGRRRIARILPAHLAAIVEQMNVLTPAEQQQLGALCKKLGMATSAEPG